ncbi:MAG: DsbA family oxidoreductase [Sarcina sp.]
MKIEIWSDFVCPYCYIGKKRLENAIKQFSDKENIEIVFRSFELDPNAEKSYEGSINEHIAEKYNMPLEQAKTINNNIIEQAKEVGLNYNFKDLIRTNTFDAHRLTHYAKEEGKMNEMSEKIFKSYFIDSLNISDHPTLIKLAKEVGLNTSKVTEVLESTMYADEVRHDEATATSKAVTGVPYFVFDEKFVVSGAQPSSVFLKVLNNTKNEADMLKNSTNSKAGICIDGKCQ